MSKIKLAVMTTVLILAVTIVAGATYRVEGPAQSLDPRAFPNLTQIYVASGVTDNNAAAQLGVATSIHCTNWTAATQQLRFLIRNFDGGIKSNTTQPLVSLGTFTASTHYTAAYVENAHLSPFQGISQGSLRIFATAAQITCTAQVIDASSITPLGVPLHLVRHNAWPGSQE